MAMLIFRQLFVFVFDYQAFRTCFQCKNIVQLLYFLLIEFFISLFVFSQNLFTNGPFLMQTLNSVKKLQRAPKDLYIGTYLKKCFFLNNFLLNLNFLMNLKFCISPNRGRWHGDVMIYMRSNESKLDEFLDEVIFLKIRF